MDAQQAVAYMREHYGAPLTDWCEVPMPGWYDKGGYLPAGTSRVTNVTGQPEPVLSPPGATATR